MTGSTLGRILITGATGRLGRALHDHFMASGTEVIGTFGNRLAPGLERLDLESRTDLIRVLERVSPDVILHAAALTDVDVCERNEALAMRINAGASEIIARYAERRGARYVYISTDYVFDGISGPYDESSTPNPLSIYGRSKLAGESPALECKGGSVARVAILYGYTEPTAEPTLVSQIIESARQRKTIRLDGRRIKYPTLTDDVARALELLLEQRKSGIFHVGHPNGISRYEWGREIAAALDIDERFVVRDDTVELGKPARRPFDVQLCDTRLGFVHTPLRAGLLQIRRRMAEDRAA